MRDDRERTDRADATIETVLAVPVLLLLIMVIIQAGLWFHGAQIMEAAAQEGVRAGRVESATAADAEERTRYFVRSLSPSLAASSQVQTSRTAATTRVTVEAQVDAVIPGIRLTVSGSAESPTERFRDDR